ncbi:MAG: tol-pal system-associated acyl-CoA thioesterase [Proteobacteria bacterium]|nr:tol-pal system-associated acyl-CoA thioesterase [Pseudomonadota bacterium]MBW3616393.1 tol-pal system-associated acyl-CoA thioesterase [Pseudomonadota bacterium]
MPVRVYYEDTDFTGVVYHANYLRYLERGRSDFLRLAAVSHTELLDRPDPAVFAVVRMTLDFRRPARVDDALTVRTTYDSFRGARLLVGQTVIRGADLLLSAVVEAACITPDGRPRRPPAGLVDKLRPYLLAESRPDAP